MKSQSFSFTSGEYLDGLSYAVQWESISLNEPVPDDVIERRQGVAEAYGDRSVDVKVDEVASVLMMRPELALSFSPVFPLMSGR